MGAAGLPFYPAGSRASKRAANRTIRGATSTKINEAVNQGAAYWWASIWSISAIRAFEVAIVC
jgi:hypothetical protein